MHVTTVHLLLLVRTFHQSSSSSSSTACASCGSSATTLIRISPSGGSTVIIRVSTLVAGYFVGIKSFVTYMSTPSKKSSGRTRIQHCFGWVWFSHNCRCQDHQHKCGDHSNTIAHFFGRDRLRNFGAIEEKRQVERIYICRMVFKLLVWVFVVSLISSPYRIYRVKFWVVMRLIRLKIHNHSLLVTLKLYRLLLCLYYWLCLVGSSMAAFC